MTESDNLDKVRNVLADAEDIQPVDMSGQGAPDDGDMPPAPPYDDQPDFPPNGPDGRFVDDDPQTPEAKGATFPLNDYGNGQRFAHYFGDDIMWVPRVGWFNWTGKVWQVDPDKIGVRRKAQSVAAKILDEIVTISLSPRQLEAIAEHDDLQQQLDLLPAHKDRTDDQNMAASKLRLKLVHIDNLNCILKDLRKSHRSFAKTTGNTGRIDALMTEGSIDLSQTLERLDANELDINTQSGLLRFKVTGGGGAEYSKVAEMELIPHHRDQLMTKIMAMDYDKDADCPKFHKFLNRIQPDPDMRAFIQRWFGLSMTGVKVQKLVFQYGNGSNGKSALIDIIARLIGAYSATVKIDAIVGKNRRSGGDATPELVPLIGARMVRASEPEQGEPLQEARIKEMTGGEEILVRGLHADFVAITPVFKLTISGNHKPEIRGTDDGIWRRVLLVPFAVRIPDGETDLTLVDTILASEGPGILNWLITGLMDYLEGGLQEPQQVLDATLEYRLDSNPIGNFLDDCILATGDAFDIISSADIMQAFNFWLLAAGMTAWRPTTISRQMAKESLNWRHRGTGNQITKTKSDTIIYEGAQFVPAFKKRFDDAPRDHTGRILSAKSGDPS